MKKQAILITAYKDINHLTKLVDFFDKDFEIYIHFDKKSEISQEEVQELNSRPIVKLISRKYKVNWGSFNHLRSIILLTTKALENEEVCYLHLISGLDYPVKPLEVFKKIFKSDIKNEFIDVFDVPKPGWGRFGGMDRLFFFNFYDVLNAKVVQELKWIKRIKNIQERIGYNRSFPIEMPKLYGGSTWWSLSRDAAKFVVDYTTQNKKVFNRFKHTLCSEEFYFQTVLMTSEFKSNIEYRNLRYIDWTIRNGNNPAVLDESDFNKIIKSEAFFARKFEDPTSVSLLNKIIRNIFELRS